MDTHMDTSMDTHMDMSMDIHMDMSMDIHMEMPIKSKVSKLDGLYIQSEPAASRALRRWSNNPSAEGRSSKRRDWISIDTPVVETTGFLRTGLAWIQTIRLNPEASHF